MLNLTNLRTLLLQVLSLPALHTAILFTPEGQLVSFASDSSRSKDEIRVVVGLSGEIWQETKEQGIGMVDSELGRLLVLPIEQVRGESEARNEEDKPMMLLALNADNSVRWDEMEKKARHLAHHLEKPVTELRGKLANAPSSPITSTRRTTR